MVRTALILFTLTGCCSAATNLDAKEERWNPQSSGPFFSGTADTTPPGSFFLEGYAYDYRQASSHSLSVPLRFDQGVTPNVEFNLTVPFQFNFQSDTHGGGMGDASFFFKNRIFHETATLPSIAWELNFSLPSGKSSSLDPLLNGADQTGQGMVQGTLTALARKIIQPFKIYAQLSYSIFGTTLMVPTYSATNLLPLAAGQTVTPGDLFYYSMSFEHVLEEKSCFGYVVEFFGETEAHHSLLNGTATNATYGRFSAGLSVEVNFPDSIQWAVGAIIPIADMNVSHREISPMLTITWNYEGPLGHR